MGWYRRYLNIPNHPAWKGKRIILTVGAADFATEGWCNGQLLGRHEGGYVPFEFDLTDTLQPGPDGLLQGLVVLRVEDPMENTEQPVGKQWKWYTTTSGIWQTVFVSHATRRTSIAFAFTPILTTAPPGLKSNA